MFKKKKKTQSIIKIKNPFPFHATQQPLQSQCFTLPSVSKAMLRSNFLRLLFKGDFIKATLGRRD